MLYQPLVFGALERVYNREGGVAIYLKPGDLPVVRHAARAGSHELLAVYTDDFIVVSSGKTGDIFYVIRKLQFPIT